MTSSTSSASWLAPSRAETWITSGPPRLRRSRTCEGPSTIPSASTARRATSAADCACGEGQLSLERDAERRRLGADAVGDEQRDVLARDREAADGHLGPVEVLLDEHRAAARGGARLRERALELGRVLDEAELRSGPARSTTLTTTRQRRARARRPARRGDAASAAAARRPPRAPRAGAPCWRRAPPSPARAGGRSRASRRSAPRRRPSGRGRERSGRRARAPRRGARSPARPRSRRCSGGRRTRTRARRGRGRRPPSRSRARAPPRSSPSCAGPAPRTSRRRLVSLGLAPPRALSRSEEMSGQSATVNERSRPLRRLEWERAFIRREHARPHEARDALSSPADDGRPRAPCRARCPPRGHGFGSSVGRG